MDILLVLGNVSPSHCAPIKKFMAAQGMLPKVVKLDQRLRQESVIRHEAYRRLFNLLEPLVIPMMDDALSYKAVEPNWDLVDHYRESVREEVNNLRRTLLESSLDGASLSAIKAIAVKTFTPDSIHYPRLHWDGTFIRWYSDLLDDREIPMYSFLGEEREDCILGKYSSVSDDESEISTTIESSA